MQTSSCVVYAAVKDLLRLYKLWTSVVYRPSMISVSDLQVATVHMHVNVSALFRRCKHLHPTAWLRPVPAVGILWSVRQSWPQTTSRDRGYQSL